MDRRTFLKGAAAGGIGAMAAGCQPLNSLSGERAGFGADRPNIMVILADDMGFADVGSYGAEIDTPNIDRLAHEGVAFTQFYNTARCSPSRASLLTGQYPHEAGVGHLTSDQGEPGYRGFMNRQNVTIAEALQQDGYFTSVVGKWHLGHEQKAYWPTRRGFDRFYGELRYVDSYFEPTHQLYLNERAVEPEGEDWYSTDAYSTHMIDFLEEAQQEDRPFFSYVAYNAPHFPLQAFQEDIDKYRGQYGKKWAQWRRRRYERQREMGLVKEEWALSEPSLLDPESERVRKWLSVAHDTQKWWDLKMAAYAAQVDRMDQNIGRLLRALERMGELDNTLIMFMSDNGGCAEDWINQRNPEGALPGDRNCLLAYGPPWANVSNTPFKYYKRWVHEGGIATPLVVRWPGHTRQETQYRRQMSHLIDILPTCLDAAGVDYPDHYNGRAVPPPEGRSLLPALRSAKPPIHDRLYWEHEGNRAVREGPWKLVASGRFSEDDWELYNMAADRTETNNLVTEYPEKARELDALYDQWAERTNVLPWEELTDD